MSVRLNSARYSAFNRRAAAAPLRPAVAAAPVPRARVVRRAAEMNPVSLKDSAVTPLMEKGEMVSLPASPGVYAVLNDAGQLQYIGLSRKMSASIMNHYTEIPELCHSVKLLSMPNGTRESLSATWKKWVEEFVAETGAIPPGNAPGQTKWQARAVKPAKSEIRLTAGKAISGVTIEDLVDQVVKGNKVVAFIKGTRTQPQCGFSHKMLTILNDTKVDYEVVNVLDEVSNPGLREIIKSYSQWPTIPQLYIKGEFVGGSDIVEEMSSNGELAAALK